MSQGIYEIVNKIDGKRYVGSSIDIDRRWRDHRRYLNKGCHNSIYLQRAWDKYGYEQFEFVLIEKCEKIVLTEREQYFLDTLNPEYNLCKVAGKAPSTKGINIGSKSIETRQKLREANLGKKLSEETKKKMSRSHSGKRRPDHSLRMKGEGNPMYGKRRSRLVSI